MRRRFTAEEKGKGIARSHEAKGRVRIQAPELDTTERIQKNSLTLIGRLTNPQAQRMWAFIPFITIRWNLRGIANGSDLGMGCFQFRFEREDDLNQVLENRPYQFDHWMVILERWAPIISPTFPCLIPFWIRLQGLPLHYWQDEMVKKIGKVAGHLEKHEITETVARVRVTVDGLQPIVKEVIVVFPNGAEAILTLEYERLENYCSRCFRLTHEARDCPHETLEVDRGIGLEQCRTSIRPRAQFERSIRASPERRDRNNVVSDRVEHQRRENRHMDRNERVWREIASGMITQGNRDERHQSRRDPRQSEAVTRSETGENDPGEERRRQAGNHRELVRLPETNKEWLEKTLAGTNHVARALHITANEGGQEVSYQLRRLPIERVLSFGDSEVPPRVSVIGVVLGEVIKGETLRYLSHPEPREREARALRVEMGKTASGIVEAATVSAEEVPRQSSINEETRIEGTNVREIAFMMQPAINAERKGENRTNQSRGAQPHSSRRFHNCHRILYGASARKRTLSQMQNNNKRRNSNQFEQRGLLNRIPIDTPLTSPPEVENNQENQNNTVRQRNENSAGARDFRLPIDVSGPMKGICLQQHQEDYPQQ